MYNYLLSSLAAAATAILLTTGCSKKQEKPNKSTTSENRQTRQSGTEFYCIDNGSATPLVGSNGISFLEGITNGQGVDPTINLVFGSSGDAIIRDAGSQAPLNVMGISTDPNNVGRAYAMVGNVAAGGGFSSYDLYEFPVSDPSSAQIVAGTTSIPSNAYFTDLELDFNNPTGSPRWIALDRGNQNVVELDFISGNVSAKHSYANFFTKVKARVTGMGWFNKNPGQNGGTYTLLHSVDIYPKSNGLYNAYVTLLDENFAFHRLQLTQTEHAASFDESGIMFDNYSLMNFNTYGSAIYTGTSTYDFSEDIDPSTTTAPLPNSNIICSQTGNNFEIWDFATKW